MSAEAIPRRRRLTPKRRIVSRLRRAAHTLRGTKLVFGRDVPVDVVVVDRDRSEDLLRFLHGYSTSVIDVNGESIHVPSIFRMLLRGGHTMLDYTVERIRRLQPRLVVTMIDTTPTFYRIKDLVPNVTTLAIQNGKRAYEFVSDLARQDGSLSADLVLTFGEIDRDVYGSRIRSPIVPIGSIRNNSIPRRPVFDSKTVALISTLRSKVDLNAAVPGYQGPTNVTYREIFDRRLMLARYVADFCSDVGLELVVLGKDIDSDAEAHRYEKVLGPEGSGWRFVMRTDQLSNYRELDRSRIVVTSSSTLGYEALARGVRTAFFMLDAMVTGNFGDRFAWPLDLGDDGPIWSHSLDRTRVVEILYFLNGLADAEWDSIRQAYVPRIIDFDPDNQRMRNILSLFFAESTSPNAEEPDQSASP